MSIRTEIASMVKESISKEALVTSDAV